MHKSGLPRGQNHTLGRRYIVRHSFALQRASVNNLEKYLKSPDSTRWRWHSYIWRVEALINIIAKSLNLLATKTYRQKISPFGEG